MTGIHDSASLSAAPESTGGADPLSDVLRTVRLNGALFFLVEASPPWLADVPSAAALSPVILPGARHLISYHLIRTGTCWVRHADTPARQLAPGDVLVIPHGDSYVMSTAPDVPRALTLEENLAFFGQMAAGNLPHVITDGADSPDRLRIVCGFLGCETLPFNPILAALPAIVHTRRPPAADDRLQALIELALAESVSRQAGGDSVLARLSELMFIELVRLYVKSLPTGQTGWLAALREPVIGRALGLLHQQPARAWTLEHLAREAGLSRSAFAERFTHFLGEPPMHYLTRWRLQLAARLLTDGAPKISAVAGEVGYESEAAFSRAFKKAVGVAPGAWRDRRHTSGT